MKKWNKILMYCTSLTLLIGMLFLSTISHKAEAGEIDYRHFFQTTTTYDDGAMTRWTGCVNTGGTCWSEESVVADCSWDGGDTWTNCNRTGFYP